MNKSKVMIILPQSEYLDGKKTKEEIYNQVYKSIQNSLLNSL